MNFSEQRRILELAAGDPALLALAAVEFAHGDLADDVRSALKNALLGAAVPHWCDAPFLAALLASDGKTSEDLLRQLGTLTVVESFTARGPNAVSVHEASRLSLREHLRTKAPEEWRVLSKRARAHVLDSDAPFARIEALYHLFVLDQTAAAYECETLSREFELTSHESLQALAFAMGELVAAGWLEGAARVEALLVTFAVRAARGEAFQLEVGVREVVTMAQAVSNSSVASRALRVLGDVLHSKGNLNGACDAYRECLRNLEVLTKAEPSSISWLHDFVVTQRRLGRVLEAQGKATQAEAVFRCALGACKRLVELDQNNSGWVREVAAAHSCMGGVLEAQGKLADAQVAFESERDVLEQLVELEPTNVGWQRDLAIVHGRVGGVFSAQGKLIEARAAFERDLLISTQLSALDPNNAAWQRHLALARKAVSGVITEQRKLTKGIADTDGGRRRRPGWLTGWLNRIEEAALNPRAFTLALRLKPRAELLDRVRTLNDNAALLQVPGVRGVRFSLRQDTLLFSCVHEGEREDVLYELLETRGSMLEPVLSQCQDYPGLRLPNVWVRMLLDAAVERRVPAQHLGRHAYRHPSDMHPFERAIPDEAYWIDHCVRLARAASRRATREARRIDPSAVARRGHHVKHHGLVRAKFVVHDRVPPELQHGVFKAKERYDAWLRVSNMSKNVRPDWVPDARGLAIKLEQARGEESQDFLLASHPVFILKDVRDYTVFQSLREVPTLPNKLRTVLFLARRPRERRIIRRALSLVPSHPLAIHYHSMSAYALGNFRAVKYLVRPVPPLPQGVVLGTDDDLRISLRRSLENTGMRLEFCLVVPASGQMLSIEDACVDWTEHAEIIPVATIKIEAQDPCTLERLQHAEESVFSLENSLPEHDPLGSLNRARKAVYRESAAHRGAAGSFNRARRAAVRESAGHRSAANG